MSGDCGNDPTENVKDWFGIDTGMTEKEFQEHQEAYIQRWIDIQETKEKERNFKFESERVEKLIKARRRENALVMYQQKLNVNAIPKFKKFGIELSDYFAGYDWQGVEPYTYATTISQVVVHGIVTGNESGIYIFKPKEIIKGSFYYEEIPDSIKIKVVNGPYNVGTELIAFIGINFNSKIITNLKDIPLYTIGVHLSVREKTKIFDSYNHYLGEIDDIKAKIRKIDKVNDTKNFYKTKF
ncbi:MAG: hypothetical protein PHH62_07135 [Endomicrobiaceae bacterium]|nr:hypothetical protein [Endomicrobiaceae bacterium]